jgi:hypothetical protein
LDLNSWTLFDRISQPPVKYVLAIILLLISFICLFRTIRYWTAAASLNAAPEKALRIVRGLRNLVIGLTAGAWSAGIFWSKGWLIIIGLVILVQEIYEMGFLSLILRTGKQIENGKSIF